jgi:hypothetical protein
MQLPRALVIIPGIPLPAEKAMALTHEATKGRYPTV